MTSRKVLRRVEAARRRARSNPPSRAEIATVLRLWGPEEAKNFAAAPRQERLTRHDRRAIRKHLAPLIKQIPSKFGNQVGTPMDPKLRAKIVAHDKAWDLAVRRFLEV